MYLRHTLLLLLLLLLLLFFFLMNSLNKKKIKKMNFIMMFSLVFKHERETKRDEGERKGIRTYEKRLRKSKE